MEVLGEGWLLGTGARIVADTVPVGLAERLREATGHAPPLVQGVAGPADLELVVAARLDLPQEGYRLYIDEHARLEAATAEGLTRAGQTLLQLLPPEGSTDQWSAHPQWADRMGERCSACTC